MTCLSCKSKLQTVYNFGKIPLVNSFNKIKRFQIKNLT